MREIFTRIEDGKSVVIESDLNAYAYSQQYLWLLSVFIKFDASSHTNVEYEEFLETKEALIIALEHDNNAKYVGSRIVDGWFELYFYANRSKGFDPVIKKILQPSHYVYESSIVKDAKWDFHYKNLAPSEVELCHIQSDKIIYMLHDEGDSLEVPREVEHYLSFDTPTQKERFLQNFALEGFQFKDEISSEEFENGIALVKKHAVTKDAIDKEVTQLFDAVKKEHGYYEGWSTTLIDDENQNDGT